MSYKKESQLNYRFAVGSVNGLRSSSYTIFTNPNKSDIYVAHRGLAKDYKASLHESGQNYIGYTTNTQHPIAMERSKKSRHTNKWIGYPIHPSGFKYHFRVIFPTDDLRLLPSLNNKAINWIEPAPEHCQLIITIVTGPPLEQIKGYPKPYNVLSSKLITDFQLPNGTKLWVIGIVEPHNSDFFQELKNSRPKNISERVIGILANNPVPGFIDLAGD